MKSFFRNSKNSKCQLCLFNYFAASGMFSCLIGCIKALNFAPVFPNRNFCHIKAFNDYITRKILFGKTFLKISKNIKAAHCKVIGLKFSL